MHILIPILVNEKNYFLIRNEMGKSQWIVMENAPLWNVYLGTYINETIWHLKQTP